MNYNKIAEQLDNAAHLAQATPQISKEHSINLQEAYGIQSISMSRRYKRGEQFVGIKLGFTSKAKMKQMGVNDMIWGRLTDKMRYNHEDKLRLSSFIHPRAEPEIAFLLAKDLDLDVNHDNAKDYVSAVAVAIEIIDSRYEDFKFSLEDVVADNCSSSAFTIGEWKSNNTPIEDISMSLLIDGEKNQSGNSSAILGNPWESLLAAARLADENGEQLLKGNIILAGAATAASYIETGQKVEARASGLGSVSLTIK